MAMRPMAKRSFVVVALVAFAALLLIRYLSLRNDTFRPNSLPYSFPTAVNWRNQPLITAVATGDYRSAKESLAAGIDVNSKYTENDDPSEWSLPIHLACETGDAEMARILVEAGADPNAVDVLGESAIVRMAARKGFTPGNAVILRYLATAGANFNATDSPAHGGNTALQRAVFSENLPMAEALIALGANVDLPDQYGDTALHFACNPVLKEDLNPAMIRVLIRHGADPTIKNHDSRTAVDYMKENHLEYLLREHNGMGKGK